MKTQLFIYQRACLMYLNSTSSTANTVLWCNNFIGSWLIMCSCCYTCTQKIAWMDMLIFTLASKLGYTFSRWQEVTQVSFKRCKYNNYSALLIDAQLLAHRPAGILYNWVNANNTVTNRLCNNNYIEYTVVILLCKVLDKMLYCT